MNLAEIKELIAIMDKSTLSVLEVRDNDTSLRLERTPLSTGPVAFAAPAEAGAPNAAEPGDPAAKTLLSPMVGTFHMLENQPLTIGTEFKKGDTLCVVEAMKLMNDIIAEEDGTIIWQAVKDGDFVEFGQLIIQYQPR